MMRRSAEAPHQWGIEHSEEAIRSFVAERDPDIVCFQELPGLVPYIDTHALVPVSTRSHHGDIATLIRSGLMSRTESRVEKGFAVITKIGDLTVANVHLAPGADGAIARLAMLHQLAAGASDPLVVLGDTNMRLSEWDLAAEMGFAVAKPDQPTWDSRVNRFNEEGAGFAAYFTTVATRGAVSAAGLEVSTKPVRYLDKSFHLSDHYPLTGDLEVVDRHKDADPGAGF